MQQMTERSEDVDSAFSRSYMIMANIGIKYLVKKYLIVEIKTPRAGQRVLGNNILGRKTVKSP